MIFFLFTKVVENLGFSILALSVVVQIISLPLYNVAEKWQKKERDIQSGMKGGIDRIKSVFKGDEQYMILSTFYKQNKYHPAFALRSTIGLMIQVPFFIAAYSFLSNLDALRDQSFFFIPDLSAPDALLTVGSLSINILPFIMTLVNILASVIYAAGFTRREKIQLYVMGGLFLVLLYSSPAGLVLYWTCNNLCSLVKNLINKTKKPGVFLYILVTVVIIIAFFYVLFFTKQPMEIKLFISVLTVLVIAIPFGIKLFALIDTALFKNLSSDSKRRTYIFTVSCIGLFALSGLFIPSALIASSPQEFSFIENYTNPIVLLQFPLFQAIGFFAFWIPAIYILFSERVKNFLTVLLAAILVLTLVDTFILTGNYGNISSTLQFETGIPRMPAVKQLLIDVILFCAYAAIVILLLYVKLSKILLPLFGIVSFTMISLTIYNTITIQSVFSDYEKHAGTSKTGDIVYNLSKDEQNVVVIMLDRAVSAFVPYIFEELPETKKQFDGFTFYPNTVSIGRDTITGIPPLHGGYEYTPLELNKRKDESLIKKHNESLLVLPTLFSDNNFEVTITDASWANYSWITDNSIFAGIPGVSARNVVGTKTLEWTQEHNIELIKQGEFLERNLILFSFFRMLPTALRGALYDNGRWWKLESINPSYKNFIDNYSSLDYLPETTGLNSDKPTFTFISSKATHEPTFLQYPQYEPVQSVTDKGPDIWKNETTHVNYHINAASIKKIAEWFDYLRENDVYDNTKIILVSDHGHSLKLPESYSKFSEKEEYKQFNPIRFNAFLFVKDFNQNDPLKIDNTFMTNADVPYLATKDVINNAINPFTGKLFDPSIKDEGILVSHFYAPMPRDHSLNTFNLGNVFWHVKDNLFNPENWRIEK